jgi:hypothetical protein
VPIRLTKRFTDAYVVLPTRIQAKLDRVLLLLDENYRHPSLQAKAIKGADGIFEARVDPKYRLASERDGDVFVLRNVGDHDPTLKNP